MERHGGDNRLFEVHPWKLRTEELRQEDMRLLESLTSLGNGYMGLRGNFTEGYSGDSVKGTYLAGVWYPPIPLGRMVEKRLSGILRKDN